MRKTGISWKKKASRSSRIHLNSAAQPVSMSVRMTRSR